MNRELTYSMQGYDPFGSLLPGRNYSSDSYAHGFNGMRKDDEVHGATGTSYDFGARLLDVRVGRWLSLDAKGSLFPGMTPYGFGAGNPIFYRDKDGNIIEPTDEKSRNQFNGAVTALFTSDGVVNETVVNMLTITGANLSGLTQDDYNTAMSTLNDPDQRAAFHGLFLSANSETAYRLTTISEGESAVVNDVEVSSIRLQMGANGVTSHRNDRLSSMEGMNQVVDVAISLESVGASKSGKGFGGVYRSGPAMVVGGLLSAFIHNDEYTALGNWNTRPLTEEIGITQLQTENMVMRSTGQGQLSGTDFVRPNDSDFGAKLRRVQNIPDQLRYQGKAFTYDPYVERDVTTTDLQ